ncbi:alpha-2-macroglobulin family protein, partial [Klebsiella pneumoniae]|nr:alpha-2-macroglobulin family protein [Klebsiella pneumoniae]
IKADGDTDYISKDAVRMLNLIAVDPSLTRIEKTNLKLVLLEQKYISVLMRQPSEVFKYQSRLKETRIDEQPLTISSAGTDITLNTSKPGHFILQAEDADGNVLNRTDYTVAGNANITRSLDRNAELQLTLNKEEYKTCEEIEIAVSAPYTGSGIITIERDKVYQWVWFRADTTNSVQKIRVPAELTGNGYVNVQFVRDINSDEIFMSPLSFGVQPFRVSHEAFNAGITL